MVQNRVRYVVAIGDTVQHAPCCDDTVQVVPCTVRRDDL